MITTAEVYLWGTRIGYVHQGEADTAARFEYDRHFLSSGIELSPFKMPLSISWPFRLKALYRVLALTFAI